MGPRVWLDAECDGATSAIAMAWGQEVGKHWFPNLRDKTPIGAAIELVLAAWRRGSLSWWTSAFEGGMSESGLPEGLAGAPVTVQHVPVNAAITAGGRCHPFPARGCEKVTAPAIVRSGGLVCCARAYTGTHDPVSLTARPGSLAIKRPHPLTAMLLTWCRGRLDCLMAAAPPEDPRARPAAGRGQGPGDPGLDTTTMGRYTPVHATGRQTERSGFQPPRRRRRLRPLGADADPALHVDVPR